MEIKVLFYGAKRRKTVWKGSMGMLYKFGKRQLLSFGLPEMPVVWLTRVTGGSGWTHGECLGRGHSCRARGYGFASRAHLQVQNLLPLTLF